MFPLNWLIKGWPISPNHERNHHHSKWLDTVQLHTFTHFSRKTWANFLWKQSNFRDVNPFHQKPAFPGIPRRHRLRRQEGKQGLLAIGTLDQGAVEIAWPQSASFSLDIWKMTCVTLMVPKKTPSYQNAEHFDLAKSTCSSHILLTHRPCVTVSRRGNWAFPRKFLLPTWWLQVCGGVGQNRCGTCIT